MSDADRTRFAGHVVDQSERMQKSVDRLIELTRLEQTQRLHDAKLQDVMSMMREALAAMQPSADAAGVRIETTGDRGEARGATIDRDLIKLAVSNVIENAIAFSPPGACVYVCARMHEAGGLSRAKSIEIVVTDHGSDVDEHLISRVGERFVSTPRPNGTPKSSGLGLAIVEQIMDSHHGSFSLANTDGGARAVMKILLRAIPDS